MLKRLIKWSRIVDNCVSASSTVTNCASFFGHFFASSSGASSDAMTSVGGGFFVSVPLLQFLFPSATAFERSSSSFGHVSGQKDTAVIRMLMMAPRPSREPGLWRCSDIVPAS
jgi:hypothetical protein